MCIEPTFWIDWVNGKARYRVFDYSRTAKTFKATSLAANRAAIASGPGTMTFSVSGTPAMTVTDAGQITAVFITDRQQHLAGPWIEFCRGQGTVDRLAAIDSSGTLWVRNATEKQAVVTSSTDQFYLLSNAAIAPGAVIAVEFAEGTP